MFAILKGLVSRARPQANFDKQEDVLRLGRYQDAYVLPIVRKQHALADEGSYFVVHNNQTGILMGTGAAYSATAPWFLVTNTDSATDQEAVRAHIDYLAFLATAAGSAASGLTSLFFALDIDNAARWSSGGTDITPNIVNTNADVGARSSVLKIYAGAIVATAATSSKRTLVGQRAMRRLAVSGTVLGVVGDEYYFNFGAVEAPAIPLAPGTVTATVEPIRSSYMIPVPPVVLGPQQSMLLIPWFPSTTPVGPTFLPEMGWWER